MFWIEKPLPEDVQAVLNAASMLDVTEFQLFELAYRHWFGREPDQGVERAFVGYMFDEQVPPWARDFARRVLREPPTDRGSRSRMGVHLHRPARGDRVRGVVYALVVFAVLSMLLWVAQGPDVLLDIARECYFPPCY